MRHRCDPSEYSQPWTFAPAFGPAATLPPDAGGFRGRRDRSGQDIETNDGENYAMHDSSLGSRPIREVAAVP